MRVWNWERRRVRGLISIDKKGLDKISPFQEDSRETISAKEVEEREETLFSNELERRFFNWSVSCTSEAICPGTDFRN